VPAAIGWTSVKVCRVLTIIYTVGFQGRAASNTESYVLRVGSFIVIEEGYGNIF
jgi:hypothetical protein